MLIIINIDIIINKKVGKVYRLFISQVTFSHKIFFELKSFCLNSFCWNSFCWKIFVAADFVTSINSSHVITES